MDSGYQGENRQWETSGQGAGEENYFNNGGYTGNPFDEVYGLCRKCRHRTIDRSENPESVLCRDCREELIRLKIPPVFYLIGAAVVLMAVFVFTSSMGGLRNFGIYNQSKSMAADGYVVTALDGLLDILEENPDNKNVAVRLADLGMKYAYYNYAAYAIDNYLVGKEVSDSQYDKLNGYIRKLDAYYATYNLYDEICGEAFADAVDEEEMNEALEKVFRELSAYIGEGGYDQALLYYYMAYMSADEEKRMACLQECVSLNPHYYDAQAQIATYYRWQGEFEKARVLLEEVFEENKEDYAVLRSYATLELVEGNLEQGLVYASEAFQIYPEGEYVLDTYIVALAANGMMEKAKGLVELYEADYVFDDDFYDFLDGKLTLEEYYTG